MEGQALSISKGGIFSQNPCPDPNPSSVKRKRNLPGTPDPDAEVIALSPKTLLATNRFLCEMCGKGFQRDQNLQLHRRGHNLPWKLRQRSSKEPIRKRVYVCPEKSCVHHHPSRALGDLTGIKKHFCRKHGEKKWKCDKCDKKYAVQSDWKAHSKTCGTREYRCDCGAIFSRRDCFITHRAFSDALAEETARISAASSIHNLASFNNLNYHPLITAGPALMRPNILQHFSAPFDHDNQLPDHAIPGLSLQPGHSPHEQIDSSVLADPFASLSDVQSLSDAQQLGCQLNFLYGNNNTSSSKEVNRSNSLSKSVPSLFSGQDQRYDPLLAPDMSATALLQKAAQIGVTSSVPLFLRGFDVEQQNCQSQDSSKFDWLFMSSGNGSISFDLGRSLESSISDFAASTNPFAMRSARHQTLQRGDLGGGETRDFLGIGAQTLCTSSISGWI